jgi:GT2 family glycosyltransferase
MIVLQHNNNKVVSVKGLNNETVVNGTSMSPIKTLLELAKLNDNSILVWCHESQIDNVDFEFIEKEFHLKNMMLSYTQDHYFSEQIGYVEDSPFLKVNKQVKYPTWLMSSQVGAIHASILLMFEDVISLKSNFDYTLNSIAKLGMINGLFCYSQPKLLKNNNQTVIASKPSTATLFKFVKQHYKLSWVFLLFFNLVFYDKKLPFWSFIKTLSFSKLSFNNIINVEALKQKNRDKNVTIDVIIPTIGRKDYLHNVVKDLAAQTLLPKNVIIVEQNPNEGSVSELDFLKNNDWPFVIKHHFIHRAGACNARNMALKEVTSDYVYLADDDNVFEATLLEDIIDTMQKYSFEAITMSYLKKDEVERTKQPIQWSTFGAGSSVINSKFLNKIAFNLALEFGYGEDVDFGMQLRNLGIDIIYFPNIKILHLNAPMGGFRTRFIHPWENDKVQPKPSPTIMLNRMLNVTTHQTLGYKTVLFFKYYKRQSIKNPMDYYKSFNKKWEQSVYWANQLKVKNK